MATFCHQYVRPTLDEQVFCQNLLNDGNPIWDDHDASRRYRRRIHLPPADFVYGLKHPTQDRTTGVASVLQQYDVPMRKMKSIIIPDFIALNRKVIRLGLTKVSDIHQYRRTIYNYPTSIKSCDCKCIVPTTPVQDMVHGKIMGERQSIRDLLEYKYLHEWLRKQSIIRCKQMTNKAIPKNPKAFLLKLNSKVKQQ